MHAAGISDLAEQMQTRLLLFDGAMGTELQARGLAPGIPPEFWTVEQPKAVRAVHQAYLEAGSEIILTNTFGANRIRLAAFGAGHRVQELNEAAAELALSAAAHAGRPARTMMVAGSIGPCGGPFTEAEMVVAFTEQAEALARAGCHLLAIETMATLTEAGAALTAAAATSLPVIMMMTFGPDGRLASGESAGAAAAWIAERGQDRLLAIGANCSFGPERLRPVVTQMARATRLPIAVKPNAGLLHLSSTEAFAEAIEPLVKAGARLIGGCCGTTPAHIRCLAARLSLTTSPGREQRLGGGGGAPTRQARAGGTAAASWAECGGAAARAPSVGHRRRPGAAKSQGEEVSWT